MASLLFPGQQADEKIYLVVREHWFSLLLQMLVWFLLILLLLAFDYYAPTYAPSIFQDPYVGYLNLFKNVYLMFIMLGAFMNWVFYYLNVQVITDIRVVDISQDSLFSHTVSELNLSHIEDTTAEIKGLFPNIFSFGNVYVQTAGRQERFVFQNVPHPDRVEKMLLDLCEQLPKGRHPDSQGNGAEPLVARSPETTNPSPANPEEINN